MAGQPRNIRIDDDIYSALIQCVAARNAKAKAEGNNELTDITKLINECLRLQMPIHIWDRLDKRVTNLEHEIKTIKENI